VECRFIEDRHERRSPLLTDQLPIAAWHEYLNEPTAADALAGRLPHGAHRLELKGESLRKKAAALTKAEGQQ
jgi:DNA replication protein DnaC